MNVIITEYFVLESPVSNTWNQLQEYGTGKKL